MVGTACNSSHFIQNLTVSSNLTVGNGSTGVGLLLGYAVYNQVSLTVANSSAVLSTVSYYAYGALCGYLEASTVLAYNVSGFALN